MLDETVKNRLKPNPKVDDQRDNEIRAREELREAMMKKNKEFKENRMNMQFDLELESDVEFFKRMEPDEWIVIQQKYGLGRYAAYQMEKEKEDWEQ